VGELARVLTVVRRVVPGGAEALGADLHPVLRRVYAARGLRSSEELKLTLERLAPVGSLGGAEAAAQLLIRHRQGRVLVVGDFDADGATSTALMLRALRGFGFSAVDFLVPNRFEYGYGLTPEIVAVAAERAPTLIITVDNGISSHAGVLAARSRGIDVLITDHHLPAAQLPDANAIVNPNVPGNGYASGALAGVGVARGARLGFSRLSHQPTPAAIVTTTTSASVPNHSNLCAMLVITGASRPNAPAPGLQVAAAQLSVVARPRCCACWASPSIPKTHGPDCQLKPVCPPKLMPLSVPGVLVASSGVPTVASLNRVLVLDLLFSWLTLPPR